MLRLLAHALLALILLAPSARAEGYGGTPVAQAFRSRPCTEVLAVIDRPEARGTLSEAIGAASRVSLYLGFLIGYDAARGGLSGPSPTTLARLRAACAAEPGASALDLLDRPAPP